MNTVIYCYDAYCGWCYGFSPVIRKLSHEYSMRLSFEVLSGGMILHEKPLPMAVTAGYIENSYQTVEEYTGIKFGADYLWHIRNPDQSDWFPDSEKPAIALCIFKELYQDKQVDFACDLGYALHYEGRDLCDDEAYRLLLEQYQIPAGAFYKKLHSTEYKEKAAYEFSLVKQLKVTGFPTLLMQETDSKFHLLARGYTDYETLASTIDRVLQEINPNEAINS
jgi:putative protein-disulfide isomerase